MAIPRQRGKWVVEGSVPVERRPIIAKPKKAKHQKQQPKTPQQAEPARPKQKPIRPSTQRGWTGSVFAEKVYGGKQPEFKSEECSRYLALEKQNKKAPRKIKQRSSRAVVSQTQASMSYLSNEWAEMKAIVYGKYGYECMACGDSDAPARVDHIKPLRCYWELRLDLDNMQVLCETCNRLKGNWSEKDYRPQALFIRKHRNKNPGISYEKAADMFLSEKIALSVRKSSA